MITTERTITICGDKSKIDEPILLYRGDFEVEVKFKIFNSKYKFQNGLNLIAVENAAYGQLAILAPNGDNVFSDVTKCVDGTVSFVVTETMIDELKEVGKYSFQIRLFDANRDSRVTTPPVEFGLIVGEPVASEDTTENVNDALVGYSIARATNVSNESAGPTFDGNKYNKTKWEIGDRITADKLNKLEDALDTINENNLTTSDVVKSNYSVLDAIKANKDEIFTMDNMGQDIREAMTGGSVAVVGRNSIFNENIVDNQLSVNKTDFFEYGNIMSYSNVVVGGINSAGTINASQTGLNTSDFIKVNEGDKILIPGKIMYLCYYNINKNSLATHIPRLSNLNNYDQTIPACVDPVHYIRVTWANVTTNEYYRVLNTIKIFNTETIQPSKELAKNSIETGTIKDLDDKILEIKDSDDKIYYEFLSDYSIIRIFMKTKRDNTYLGYQLRKMTGFDHEVWRLRAVKAYEKDDRDQFTEIYSDTLIHEASEWECAIKEKGMPDFVGGSTHGDEFMESIIFIVDGVPYTNAYHLHGDCKEFKAIRKTKLYRCNSNKGVHIGDHYVEYTFSKNEIIIDNRVDWKVDTTCGISYLCMLGARRLNGTTQITSNGLKHGDGRILDISNEGHANTGITKGCRKAYAWNNGDGLKTMMSVEILENNFFDTFNFKFDNRADYNKFYFDQCGDNFPVTNGDIWFNKALYKIDLFGI